MYYNTSADDFEAKQLIESPPPTALTNEFDVWANGVPYIVSMYGEEFDVWTNGVPFMDISFGLSSHFNMQMTPSGSVIVSGYFVETSSYSNTMTLSPNGGLTARWFIETP